MKKYFMIIGLAALVLNSCVDEQIISENNETSKVQLDLSEEELASISYDDLSEFTQNEVYGMVTNFLNTIKKEVKTRSFSKLSFTVKAKEYLGDKLASYSTRSDFQMIETPILVYELAIDMGDNNAYAFVSADKRAPGVLAFFDKLPNNEQAISKGLNHPNTKAMVTLAKMQVINDVERIETLKKELRNKTIEKNCQRLDISIDNYSFDKIEEFIGIATTRNHPGTANLPPQQIVAYKEPMCKILWDQNEPYNRACPEGTRLISLGEGYSFTQPGRVPAGCVTIACMSIEACVERSTIGNIPMNWNYYKNAKILFDAQGGQQDQTPILELERAGKAIAHIYNQLQSYSLYAYHNGTRYVYATASFLGESYIINNFNCTSLQNFNPDAVLASLNANKPVYVSGQVYGTSTTDPKQKVWEGHAFAIDGYAILKKATTNMLMSEVKRKVGTRANIVQYYDMYWHIYLGWGKSSNAYFKLDSDATCTPEFIDQYDRYNLVPLKDMKIIANISKK